MRVLVVEDEAALRDSLKERLAAAGFSVDVARDGNEGLFAGLEYPLDVAIVDLGLPNLPGLEVIRRLRAARKTYPILILTARDNWQDKVEGLQAGADDYVAKPFHFEEVLARLQALLRRAGGWASPQLSCGPVTLDTRAQTVQVSGVPVELTTFEYRILEHLMLRAGDVISKTELTERLYDQDFERDSNVIVVLDTGFRALSERSLQELLDSQMVSLIAAADPQPDGSYAPSPQELDPRLRTPRSGLYAQIRSQHHLWRSPSTAGLSSDFGALLVPGERNLAYAAFGHDRVAIESRAIQFADDPKGKRTLTFSVAVSLSPYEEQLWRFRRELVGWFAGLMLVLLATLAALLRWVLGPVRRMEREIHEMEEGRCEALGDGYPRELSGVATNLNALLLGERKRVARYRDTLGNLAHSLKTPLAVMRASLSGERPPAPWGRRSIA